MTLARLVDVALLLVAAPRDALGAAPPLSSLPLPLPAPTERGEYRALDLRTGAELWRTRWTVEQTVKDGQPILRATETGAGRRSTSASVTWTVAMELDLSRTHGHLIFRRGY